MLLYLCPPAIWKQNDLLDPSLIEQRGSPLPEDSSAGPDHFCFICQMRKAPRGRVLPTPATASAATIFVVTIDQCLLQHKERVMWLAQHPGGDNIRLLGLSQLNLCLA